MHSNNSKQENSLKERLYTPGPTPVPESVTQVMAAPVFLHRSERFRTLFEEISEDLKYVFRTKNDVLTFTSSGTGAMEAAVVNLLSQGDRVLTVQGGKFGQRWTELCQIFGLETLFIDVEWGKAIDPTVIGERLSQTSDIQAVFITHSETSTGVANDVQAIARIVRENSDAVLVVDGISSVGVMPLKMDEWDIDVAVAGSQKGFMLPPGLAFVSVSNRAWQAVKGSTLPKYYFSFLKAKDALATHDSAYTPAISLLVGLRESLTLIRSEGLENVWTRHVKLARATRAAVQALGLTLFAESPSNALTAVRVPDDLEAATIINHLRERYGITVAGGQGKLKGKIFRIGHLGHYDERDIMAVISALEQTLGDLGWAFELGSGVQAAQNIFSSRTNV